MGLKLDAAEAAVRNQAVGSGRPADKPAKGGFRNRQVRELQNGAQPPRVVKPERSIAQSLKEKSAVGPANPGEPDEKGARRGRFKSVVSKALSVCSGRRKSNGGTTIPGMLKPLENFEPHKVAMELPSALPSLDKTPSCGSGSQFRHGQTPSTRLGPPPEVPTEQSPHQLSAVVPRKGRASNSRGASERPERSRANQPPSLDEKRKAARGKTAERRAGAQRNPNLSSDSTHQLRKAHKDLCPVESEVPEVNRMQKPPTSTEPAGCEPSSSPRMPTLNTQQHGTPRQYDQFTNHEVFGSALGERFPLATNLQRQAFEIDTQYKQPPHLTRTVLRDSNGRTIYSGLRHGAIVPKIGHVNWCQAISDAEQFQALQDLLPDDHPYHTGQDYPEQEINRLLPRFHDSIDEFHDWRWRDTLATNIDSMKTQAARNMARKVAATALAADPERLRQALARQPVCLKLFHVVLMPNRCRYGWPDHQNAFAALEKDSPVPLQVRGADGRPQTVRVDIKLRHFSFPRSQCCAKTLFTRDEEQYSQLLGASGSRNELGGDVMAKVRELNAAAAEIHANVSTLETNLERFDRSSQGDVLRKKIQTLKDDLSRIENNACALQNAGEQLKSIRDFELETEVLAVPWIQKLCPDPYERLGARLGLVAHLIGETPILTACETGAAETLHLDAAVKYLAKIASEHGGDVPTVMTERDPLLVCDYKSFRTKIGCESEPGRGVIKDRPYSPSNQMVRGF